MLQGIQILRLFINLLLIQVRDYYRFEFKIDINQMFSQTGNTEKESEFKLSKRDQFRRDIRNKQHQSIRKSARFIDRAKLFRQRLSSFQVLPQHQPTLNFLDEIIQTCNYQEIISLVKKQDSKLKQLLDFRIYQIIEKMILNRLSDPRVLVLAQILLQNSQKCIFAFYDQRVAFKIVQEVSSLGKNKSAVSIYFRSLILLTNQSTLIIEDQIQELQSLVQGYLLEWGQSKLLIQLIVNLAKIGFFWQDNQVFLKRLCQQYWNSKIKMNQINIYTAVQQIVQNSRIQFQKEVSHDIIRLLLQGSDYIPSISSKKLVKTLQKLFYLVQKEQKEHLAEQFGKFIQGKQANQQCLVLLKKMIQSCSVGLMWSILNVYQLLPKIVQLLNGTSFNLALQILTELMQNSSQKPDIKQQVIQVLISLNVRQFLQDEYDQQVDKNTLKTIEYLLQSLNSQMKFNDPKFIGHMKGF